MHEAHEDLRLHGNCCRTQPIDHSDEIMKGEEKRKEVPVVGKGK